MTRAAMSAATISAMVSRVSRLARRGAMFPKLAPIHRGVVVRQDDPGLGSAARADRLQRRGRGAIERALDELGGGTLLREDAGRHRGGLAVARALGDAP